MYQPLVLITPRVDYPRTGLRDGSFPHTSLDYKEEEEEKEEKEEKEMVDDSMQWNRER